MGSHTTESSEESPLPESAPSSPPETGLEMDFVTPEEKEMLEEDKRAEAANKVAEERRKKLILKKKKEQIETKQEREAKAAQLDELLRKSAAFSNILTKKTEVLGRVGSGLDGKALGDHDLVMAKQPKSMINGTMRPYQLEGLTWMMEICQQGMSGILADEMGLGKTIQTISLIALLREQENYLGPHLIVAPLSTLSNWIDEFQKWTPNVPVLLYHGPPGKRQELRRKQILNHIKNGRPDEKFPVVCTSYDMVIRDEKELSKINWEMIIIVSIYCHLDNAHTDRIPRTRAIE
jgi:ATP-dependent DNA helicase